MWLRAKPGRRIKAPRVFTAHATSYRMVLKRSIDSRKMTSTKTQGAGSAP